MMRVVLYNPLQPQPAPTDGLDLAQPHKGLAEAEISHVTCTPEVPSLPQHYTCNTALSLLPIVYAFQAACHNFLQTLCYFVFGPQCFPQLQCFVSSGR